MPWWGWALGRGVSAGQLSCPGLRGVGWMPPGGDGQCLARGATPQSCRLPWETRGAFAAGVCPEMGRHSSAVLRAPGGLWAVAGCSWKCRASPCWGEQCPCAGQHPGAAHPRAAWQREPARTPPAARTRSDRCGVTSAYWGFGVLLTQRGSPAKQPCWHSPGILLLCLALLASIHSSAGAASVVLHPLIFRFICTCWRHPVVLVGIPV